MPAPKRDQVVVARRWTPSLVRGRILHVAFESSQPWPLRLIPLPILEVVVPPRAQVDCNSVVPPSDLWVSNRRQRISPEAIGLHASITDEEEPIASVEGDLSIGRGLGPQPGPEIDRHPATKGLNHARNAGLATSARHDVCAAS